MDYPKTLEEEEELRAKFWRAVIDGRAPCGRSVKMATPPRMKLEIVKATKEIVTGCWVRVDIFVAAAEVK